MNKKIRTISILAIGVIIIIIISLSSKQSTEFPSIGVISPQDGVGSEFGLLISNTVKFALEDIGFKNTNVVIENGKCNKQTARAAVDRLIESGIRYIIAGGCSDEALGVSEHPSVVNGDVFAISVSATSSKLSEVSQIFRTIISDEENVNVIVNDLKIRNIDNIVIIRDEGEYAKNYIKDLKNKIEGKINIVDEVVYKRNSNDLYQKAVYASKLSTDVFVFVPQGAEDAIRVIETIRSVSNKPIYEPSALKSESVRAILGDDVEGVIYSDTPNISAIEKRFDGIKKRYEKKYDLIEYNTYFLATYDSILLLQKAYKTIGNNPQKVAEFFRLNKHKDGSGTGIDRYTFSDNGDSINELYKPILKIVRGGRSENF